MPSQIFSQGNQASQPQSITGNNSLNNSVWLLFNHYAPTYLDTKTYLMLLSPTQAGSFSSFNISSLPSFLDSNSQLKLETYTHDVPNGVYVQPNTLTITPSTEFQPLLAKLDALKDFFDENSYNALNQYKRYLNNEISQSDFLAYISNSINTYGDSEISLNINNINDFLKLNKILASGATEQERVGLLALWLGNMQDYYNQSRANDDFGVFFSSLPGQDVISGFLSQSEPIGICGDINGSAAYLIAQALGLEQASIATGITNKSVGHVISFIKGKEGFYIVDYGDAYYLGRDPDLALDKIFTLPQYSFSPFAASRSTKTFFLESPTQEILSETLRLKPEELLKTLPEGFNSSFHAGEHGQLGFSLGYKIKKMNVGLFYAESPTAASAFEGAYLDWRNFEGKKGSVFLPRLQVSIMNVDNLNGSFPLFMAQLIPYSLTMALNSKDELRLTPLTSNLAITSESFSSTLGYFHSFSPNSKGAGFYVQANLGWVAAPTDFYNLLSIRPAAKLKAGIKNEKGSLDVSVAPGTWGDKLKLDAGYMVADTKKLSLLGTLSVDALGPDGKLIRGATVGFQIFLKNSP